MAQLTWGLPAGGRPESPSLLDRLTPAGVKWARRKGVNGGVPAAAAMTQRDVSEAGLRLIRDFEGMVLHLYGDPGRGCHCTIGVGHLVHHGPCDGRPEEAPFLGGMTEAEAFELLRQDLARFSAAVEHLVVVPLTQHQFDALVS